MAKIWRPKKKNKLSNLKIHTIVNDADFRFPDMEIFWNGKFWSWIQSPHERKTSVNIINSSSYHTKKFFNTISNGFSNRLSKLTSSTPTNLESKTNIFYPHPIKALNNVKLVPKTFPKAKDVLVEIYDF